MPREDPAPLPRGFGTRWSETTAKLTPGFAGQGRLATGFAVPGGDVTAVVLSVGEPYTERALASVQRQVPAAADVVIVRGTVPFHRALNAGAGRVEVQWLTLE